MKTNPAAFAQPANEQTNRLRKSHDSCYHDIDPAPTQFSLGWLTCHLVIETLLKGNVGRNWNSPLNCWYTPVCFHSADSHKYAAHTAERETVHQKRATSGWSREEEGICSPNQPASCHLFLSKIGSSWSHDGKLVHICCNSKIAHIKCQFRVRKVKINPEKGD